MSGEREVNKVFVGFGRRIHCFTLFSGFDFLFFHLVFGYRYSR